MTIADLRKDYTRAGLDEADADPDPFAQFERWFAEAQAAGVLEPNAMTLATATPDGQPSARIVLMKGFDANGLVFYTNYESQKGAELAVNPRAALLFYWGELERQVRLVGPVSRVSREEAERYFRGRPPGSRIGSAASRQSRPIPDRAVLEREVARLDALHPDGDVPLPPFWGGYRLIPERFEFWQGRPSRLHDRLRYLRRDDGSWAIARLLP